MRFSSRTTLVAIGLGLFGSLATSCQSPPDLTTLRNEVIVELPGAKLTGADLERWLMASPGGPSQVEASYLTTIWIDQALFAEALRQGIPLTDSTVVDSVIWTDAAMLNIGNFFNERAIAGPRVTDAQADSLFNRGEVRVFQRLKFDVQPEADSAARIQAEAKVENLRTRAATGEDFSKIVRDNTSDPRDRASSGLLPAVSRDSLPKDQMYSHLWTLRPGDYSRVYSNDIAAVLFGRPTAEVARPMMKMYLFPLLRRHADSVFVDSLVSARQVTLVTGAVDRLRALAAEPVVVHSAEPLVTWSGGQLDEAAARQWLIVLDPNRRAAIEQMSDVDGEAYLRELTQRYLLLDAAARPVILPAVRTGLSTRLAQSIDELRKRISPDGSAPGPGAPNTIIDSLTIGLHPYQPIPGGLAGYLRSRFQFNVNTVVRDKVLQAVQIQWSELHAGDKKVAGQ